MRVTQKITLGSYLTNNIHRQRIIIDRDTLIKTPDLIDAFVLNDNHLETSCTPEVQITDVMIQVGAGHG